MTFIADRTFRNRTVHCLLAGMICLLCMITTEWGSAQEFVSLENAAKPGEPVVVEDLKTLAENIENEQERRRLIGQIHALIALQNQKDHTVPEKSFSIRLVERISKSIKETFRWMSSFGWSVSHQDSLPDWFRKISQIPEQIGRLSRQAIPFLLILAAAWISEFIADRFLVRFRKRIENRPVPYKISTFWSACFHAALRLSALVVFAVTAFTGFLFFHTGSPIDTVAMTAFSAYIIGRIIMIFARMILAPSVPALRLVPLNSESAIAWFSWIRRLVTVTCFGYFLAGAALPFGLPDPGFSNLMDFLGLLLLVMMIAGILQHRKVMALWIRGQEKPEPSCRSFSQHFRSTLSDVWHIPVIFYLIGMFVIWWQRIEGGLMYLIRGTFLSILILGTVHILLQRILPVTIIPKISDFNLFQKKSPFLAQRLKHYMPSLIFMFRAGVMIIAAFAFLEAWRVDAHQWLSEPFVQQFLSFIVSMLLVISIAVVIWETFHIATEQYLFQLDKPGHTPEHRIRLRTLLPLMRKALTVVLTVIVVLIMLSEFGIDIGPLMAGAGIIGLAVGFGSQKLVQDIITGVFILVEDAVAVGDVVTVAGIGGLVEDISIRSIRLRDQSGSVHTIPFSSVDTVTNMTRLYAYYVLDIGIAYREDTDHVAEVCRNIVDTMRSDPEFGPDILEPLEVLGVDQFAESAVIIKARIKTRPIKQWKVGREFNRRMKKRFDEIGIEIPFPHRTVFFGTGTGETSTNPIPEQ